jgi:hypothetical protein
MKVNVSEELVTSSFKGEAKLAACCMSDHSTNHMPLYPRREKYSLKKMPL